MMGSETTLSVASLEQLMNVPGWCPADQLQALFKLACSTAEQSGDFVEIGTWHGRSAGALALAAQALNDARLFCFDLFPDQSDWSANSDGTYSFSVEIDGRIHRGCDRQTVWREVWEQTISPTYDEHGPPLAGAVGTLQRLGVYHLVEMTRGTSSDLPRVLSDEATLRLAYLDGEHSYEAVVRDVQNVLPMLGPGGWLCFDDAFSSYSGVDQAIDELVIDSDLFCSASQITRKLFVARRTDASLSE